MGFRKNWDLSDLSRQIGALSRECASPYNDGFTSFECKKDLYQLKELIDRALRDSPSFGSIESDWLEEQEKKKLISILKTKETQ